MNSCSTLKNKKIQTVQIFSGHCRKKFVVLVFKLAVYITKTIIHKTVLKDIDIKVIENKIYFNRLPLLVNTTSFKKRYIKL